MLSAVDVLLLARFIAAAQQEHQGLVPDRVIDVIALGHVDPQLADPLAHAPVVAEIAFLNTVNANSNPRLRLAVPQCSHPAAEGLAQGDCVCHTENCIQLDTDCQGGYASSGRGCPQGLPVSRLSIIIRGTVMAIRAIHPGEHLAEELKELKMSAAALARKIEVPTNRVTAILNGQRAVTADTALRLAHFFGTSPEFWLNLQQRYELRLAEQRARKDIKTLPTLTLPPTLFADS